MSVLRGCDGETQCCRRLRCRKSNPTAGRGETSTAFSIPIREIPCSTSTEEFVSGLMSQMLSCGFAVGRWLYVCEQVVDDIERGDPFALGFKVGNDAVAQHGRGDSLDVFDGNRVAPLQNGARFGAEDEILRGARTGAPFDVIFDIRRGFIVLGPGTLRQSDRIGDDEW